MGTLYDWSTTASSNGSADATVNFAEGQLAPTLNNSSRALMARVKAWAQQQAGIASGGSSNAYTYTSPAGHAFSALVTNSRITFKANHTNTGAATLAVDGLAATAIRKTNGATALVAGDLVSGQIYDVVYDGTYWVLIGVGAGTLSSSYQPLDADLTAIAALGYTSGEYLIKKTAADTWALVAETAYAHLAGTETFTGAKTFSTTPTIFSNAHFYLNEAAAGTNEKNWRFLATGGDFCIGAVNDALSSANYPLIITRTGITVDSIALAATAITANGNTVYHAGNLPGTAITWLARERFASDTGREAPTLGSAHGSLQVSNTDPSYGIIMGVSASVGTGWIQAQRVDGTGTAYKLSLNPSGGEVVSAPIQARVAVSSETSGTLTSESLNKQVRASGGVTIPASVAASDDIIVIRGMGTARTITRGSGLTMYVNGTNVATATLTARGTMSVVFDSATVCTLHGDVS